jgi:pimeloyl-ACP methyl ester carboxylesterase/ketosteroid isomerase-like protein
MRRLTVVFLLLAASAAYAADPVEEVRQTEMAFAKAFADRDQARFFSFVADDANFLGSKVAQNGKAEVVKRWSNFFKDQQAPFSWAPERVAVNAAAGLGLSTGPVYDPQGYQIGNYSSIWQRQKDGRWKIIFDSPGPCAPPQALVEEGFITTDDGVKLHYRKVGDGRQVVIIPLDFVMFDDFRQLGDQATVVTYDMRSRGKSDRADVALSIERDVQDLEQVRRFINADRVVPIGFSYLGYMVALYALEQPGHVARMIQLGPLSWEEKFPPSLMHGDSDIGASAEDVRRWREMRASGQIASSPREFCEAEWRVMKFVLVGDPTHANHLKSACDMENEWPSHLDGVFGAMRKSITNRALTSDEVRRIAVPVLTIHGTYDRNAPYGGGRQWALTLPNGRLITVDRAAHASWVDAPDIVFPAIRAFLRGEWPASAEKVTSLERRD